MLRLHTSLSPSGIFKGEPVKYTFNEKMQPNPKKKIYTYQKKQIEQHWVVDWATVPHVACNRWPLFRVYGMIHQETGWIRPQLVAQGYVACRQE